MLGNMRDETTVLSTELPKYLLTVLQRNFLLEIMMEYFPLQSPKGLNIKSRTFISLMNYRKWSSLSVEF